VKFVQLFQTNIEIKICDTSNFKKAIDKSLTKDYNGIVNSKGAADVESVALFFGLSANSIHEGVYEVSGLLHPFDIYAVLF
jgi:hypothetical protein